MKIQSFCIVLVLFILFFSPSLAFDSTETETTENEEGEGGGGEGEKDERLVEFMLRFKGRCYEQSDHKPYCFATANSQSLTTVIHHRKGISMQVFELIGSFAKLNFHNITFIEEDRWVNTGNITFGSHLHKPHALRLEILDSGKAFKHQEGHRNLVATYNITDGMGEFEGARGTLTMNALCNSRFHLTIYATGILWINKPSQLSPLLRVPLPSSSSPAPSPPSPSSSHSTLWDPYTRLKQQHAKKRWEKYQQQLREQPQPPQQHDQQSQSSRTFSPIHSSVDAHSIIPKTTNPVEIIHPLHHFPDPPHTIHHPHDLQQIHHVNDNTQTSTSTSPHVQPEKGKGDEMVGPSHTQIQPPSPSNPSLHHPTSESHSYSFPSFYPYSHHPLINPSFPSRSFGNHNGHVPPIDPIDPTNLDHFNPLVEQGHKQEKLKEKVENNDPVMIKNPADGVVM